MAAIETVVGRFVRAVMSSGREERFNAKHILLRSGMSGPEFDEAFQWFEDRKLLVEVEPPWIGNSSRYKFAEPVLDAWKNSLKKIRPRAGDSERSEESPWSERSEDHHSQISRQRKPSPYRGKSKERNLHGRPGRESAPQEYDVRGVRKGRRAGPEPVQEDRRDSARLSRERRVVQRLVRGGRSLDERGVREAGGSGRHGVGSLSAAHGKILVPFSEPIRDWSAHVPNEVIFSELSSAAPDPELLNEAREVHRRYVQVMATKRSAWQGLGIVSWEEVPERDKQQFVKAARTARTSGVKAPRFVAAQFWWFERFNRDRRGHVILPMPNHLHGEAAFNRVEEYEEFLEDERSRKSETRQREAFNTEYARLQRKLRQLSELLGVEQREVLVLVPREFNKSFHERKGTWPKVSRSWMADED